MNQYFLHARICENWGYERLYEKFRHESIDEMKDADELIERVLYLEGLPNVQRYNKVNVGENVPEMFRLDLELEKDAIAALNAGIALCRDKGDNGSAELLEDILEGEEEHADWLETQLTAIDQVGAQNYLAEQLKKSSAAPVGARVGTRRALPADYWTAPGRLLASSHGCPEDAAEGGGGGRSSARSRCSRRSPRSIPTGSAGTCGSAGDARRMEDENARLAAENGRLARRGPRAPHRSLGARARRPRGAPVRAAWRARLLGRVSGGRRVRDGADARRA